MKRKAVFQNGQVVLITLLVLTIATTVALSLISRTTTDLTISTQVEESSRAFSAAEAGIEQALKSGMGTTGAQVLTSGVTFNVNVTAIGDAPGFYEFPKKTTRGVTETIWLVPHDTVTGALQETSPDRYTASSISLCWSQETPVPALAVTLLYKRSGAYEVAKLGIDSDAVRAGTNKFSSANIVNNANCGDPDSVYYKRSIVFTDLNPVINPVVDTLIALRVRPVYSDTKIIVDSGLNTLPLQGNRIESTGTTVTGTNRKIVVYQQYRSPSSIFDAALYSQGVLTK